MATRHNNRWDSDDSDQDISPVQRAGPSIIARDFIRRTAGPRDSDRLSRSPLSNNDVEMSAGRNGERENRVVVGLDYGTTATGESRCILIYRWHTTKPRGRPGMDEPKDDIGT